MTFPADQRFLVIDFETYSECDLKACGPWIYSRHPSTEILCAAYRIGTREKLKTAKTKTWVPEETAIFADYILDPDVILVAHNAGFESAIVRNVLNQYVGPERWLCTVSMAAALALPRKLGDAAAALKLPVQKDMEGHRLMLKLSKPRRPSKHNPSTRHNDPDDLNRLVQYCATDIDTEVEFLLKLPMLISNERQVWMLDQRINWRGLYVDRELVNTTLDLIGEELSALDVEATRLTGGRVTRMTQRQAVLDFIQDEGVFIPNLTAKTVADALASGLADDAPAARRLLEIRQSSSKTSTAKYEAFRARTDEDNRCRDNLMYHGASTGRWAGTGVQPQNFPRGAFTDDDHPDVAQDIVKSGSLDLVRACYGDPMTVFSSCLRGVITAPPGKSLYCADFAAIEARVLFWFADHALGLKAFRENRKIYEEQAMAVYGISLLDVTKNQRAVGKECILGCGFGMGPDKFFDRCRFRGIDLDHDTAVQAVSAYRTTHRPVTVLWENIQRAAIKAVQTPGYRIKVNHTVWFVRGDFLYCELPSGRRLAYYGPTIRHESRFKSSEPRPTLYHWGSNPVTKKWEESGTYYGVLVENIVQATARDLMVAAMFRCEAQGYETILTVHDEILSERADDGKGSIEEFNALMAEVPNWAAGCPVKVEGFTSRRYRK